MNKNKETILISLIFAGGFIAGFFFRKSNDNEELGTRLGDLNAYLADINRQLNDPDGNLNQVKEDVKTSYSISNGLYSKYVKYDKNK